MKLPKSIILFISIIALALAGLSLYTVSFLRSDRIWDQLLQYDEPDLCDVIFVPSGGLCSRFPRAAELFRAGYGSILLVILEMRPSENGECVEKYDLLGQMGMFRRMAEVEGIPEEKLVIRANSPSSYDDCLFLEEYFIENRFASVMVVTDPIHGPRVVTLIESLIPELNVVNCPTVEKTEVRKFYNDDLVYLASEYLKSLVYRVKY